MKTRHAVLLIAAVSILIYANSLDNAFQYDDQVYLEENTHIKTIGLKDIFLKPSALFAPNTATGHYRPLVLVSYVINYRLLGLNPFGYHLVNLAFHIGAAFLVYLIARAMLEGQRDRNVPPIDRRGFLTPSIAAALIFAVHPFNSEAVNYITARSSLMSGFFYLLAFYSWVLFRRKMSEVRSKMDGDRSGFSNFLPLTSYFYIISLLAFLLAMLSKELAITLPAVLWLYDLYFSQPVQRRDRNVPPIDAGKNLTSRLRLSLAYLPFVLVVAVPALVIRVFYWGGVFPSFNRPLPVQLYTELPVLVKQLGLFVFPAGLNIDHHTEVYTTFFAWPVAGSALILTLYLLLAFLALRSKRVEWRVVSFFMLWFFIVLLPTIVIPLNAIFQENRSYLAILVFAVFAGVLLGKLNATPLPLSLPLRGTDRSKNPLPLRGRDRVGVGLYALTILVFLYGAGAVHRNGVWQDGVSLWSDAAAKSPQSSRAHTNLGTAYASLEKNEKAIESLMKAIRLSVSGNKGELANIHYNLGAVYQQMGRDDMAVGEYRRVTELRPSDFRPYYNLGVLYQQRGEDAAALEAYKDGMKRNPADFRSYHNIGLLYQNRGETSLAAWFYRKALSINPDYAKSRVNLEAINGPKGR